MSKDDKLYDMSFAKIYSLYIQKANRKNRTKEEVDKIILWFTNYSENELNTYIETEISVKDFFNKSSKINKNMSNINGKICGIKISEIKDSLMKKIRYLDKLIDDLAKDKDINKILK